MLSWERAKFLSPFLSFFLLIIPYPVLDVQGPDFSLQIHSIQIHQYSIGIASWMHHHLNVATGLAENCLNIARGSKNVCIGQAIYSQPAVVDRLIDTMANIDTRTTIPG